MSLVTIQLIAIITVTRIEISRDRFAAVIQWISKDENEWLVLQYFLKLFIITSCEYILP